MSEPEAGDPRAALPPGAGPFGRHVFVCVSGKTCPADGGLEIHAALKAAAKARLGRVAVRVNRSGCLAQCGHGPMIVVYPENVWYAGVSLADVPDIVEQHLVRGKPVERLLLRGHLPGPNVAKPGA